MVQNQCSAISDRATTSADLVRNICDFDEFGKKTTIVKIDDIEYFSNEFWTSGQRRSHSIHEISYRACFKSQLPEFFTKRLTRNGDTVHDPFTGVDNGSKGTNTNRIVLLQRQ